ncbi:hypothetical protein IDJ81_07140 [Tsuneonella flava]|uniref:Uncharacterized protein n=1 Tax=Tsuneonella flava TaxID=2055955 RepID=A0ABX7KC43_9SPHN|nr:hypothetical protein [Tsuneonella flava]QSB45848.1 hypothetical protein IDJ81_07140 [Tsuneonella flava]
MFRTRVKDRLGGSLEGDVLDETGGVGQQSYKGGDSMLNGTKGSIRVDCVADNCAIEVKNCDLSRTGGQSSLIRDASNSINKQADNITPGMDQELVIDVRGQTVTEAQKIEIRTMIVDRTNGNLTADDIEFLE